MKVSDKIMEQDGGKRVPNKIIVLKTLVVAVVFLGAFIFFLSMDKDDSHLRQEKIPLHQKQQKKREAQGSPLSSPRGISKSMPVVKRRSRPKATNYKNVALSVSQVIERTEEPSRRVHLPSGTSAVGKLLHIIDTRTTKTARASLPYGMAHKEGRGIPKGSILMGTVSQGGDKITIRFQKVVFPDGREFSINAHALDPKDFDFGLRGERHGNMDLKMAAAMGLSMVGTMGEVLSQKEALGGEYGQITVKSTLKDATLSGISEVAKGEASRRMEALNNEAQREYVTIPRGEAVIVTLVETFVPYLKN